MKLNFFACTAQELHDAGKSAHVFHLESSVAVTKLGDSWHVFDLNGDVEEKLAAEYTTPERLLAHAQGFFLNRQVTRLKPRPMVLADWEGSL